MKRIFGLDILRSFAIISVLLFHITTVINPSKIFTEFAIRGWAGVDLFFVLSGFLVGNQILGKNEKESSLRQCYVFWVKRWTRTVPLYIVVLFFYVIIKPTIFNAPFQGFSWKWLFFLQNVDPIRDFGQTWSLAIEEQFYFAFPILALLFSRFTPFIWLVPMLVSIVYRGWVSTKLSLDGVVTLDHMEYLWALRFPTWAMLDSISMGVFLARTYHVWSKWSLKIKKSLGVMGFVIISLTLFIIPEFTRRPFEITVLYFLLACGFGAMLVYFESVKEIIRPLAFLESIALWSYSSYLIHMIVVRLAGIYLIHLNSWLILAIYLSAVFAVSWISFELIEQNGMKLRKLILKK